MNFKKTALMLPLLACIIFGLMIDNIYAQARSWKVVSKYAKLQNPVKSDESSISTGKALFEKICASCHGKKGLGDGTKAAGLATQCPDMTKTDFQNQSDGEIFGKMTLGRDEMPSFEKKIAAENDRWAVVNYIRTLKK